MSDLGTLLASRGYFELVSSDTRGDAIRIFGRIKRGMEKVWLLLVQALLLRQIRTGWSLDISQQWQVVGDKCGFYWRIIMSPANVADIQQFLLEYELPVAVSVVTEVELPTRAKDRNATRAFTINDNTLGARPMVDTRRN